MDIEFSTPQSKCFFKLTDDALVVKDGGTSFPSISSDPSRLTINSSPESSELTVPHHHVLSSSYDDETHLMHVAYLIQKPNKKKGTTLELVKVTGTVEDEVQAFEFSENVMSAVYEGELPFNFS